MNITKRQREVMREINNFIEKKEKSPTYKDLRELLKVKSDQAVIQLLEKLEKLKFITRAKNKARGIEITRKAYEDLPELNADKLQKAKSSQTTTPIYQEYDLTQKKLIEKLKTVNIKLVGIYEGAIHTLTQKSNPDWIAQSAHSIREISKILGDEAKTFLTKDEKTESRSENATFSKKMLNYNDPRAQLTCLKKMFGKTIYDEWNEFHLEFTAISHHKDIDEERYLEKITEYERFLLKYVFTNQVDIYKLIDKEIKKGVDEAKKKEFHRLLSQNLSALQYFFNKIDSKWLSFVYENGFLVPIQSIGEYLVRIAIEEPEDVMDIILNYEKKYPIKDEDRFFRNYFIDATLVMPSNIAKKIVDKIITDDWVKKRNQGRSYWAFDMKKIIKKFIIEKEHESAVMLLKELLEVKIEKDKSISLRDVSSYIDKYVFHEIVKSIEDVPENELVNYVSILVDKLRIASELVVGKLGENKDKDSTYIWYQFIEEGERMNTDDVCDVLIIYIKKYLTKYIDYLIKNKKTGKFINEEFNKLFSVKDDYFAFQMIQIAIFRKYPNYFKDKIQWIIVEKFDKYELSQEYDQLLFETFNSIDNSFKEKYYELVKLGPKGERDANYIKRWKIEKYALVKKSLTPVLKKEYKKLLGKDQEPKVPRSDFGISTSWVGPTTPKKENELKEMDLEKIIDLFINWKPGNRHFDHSRVGLAREFAKIVQKMPEYFSENASYFNNDMLRPVYLYEYYFGLRESLKNNAKINWEKIIDLSLITVKKAKQDKLLKGEFKEDGFVLNWNTVFQYMASLIEGGLNKDLIDISLRQKVLEIISFICENKEPTLKYEKEYGADNSDNYHLSINTVRGVAFHALFAYIFWADRQLKLKEKNGSRIVKEAKEILEKHLDLKNEPGNVIQSVYGRYFYWLYIYDKEWGKKQIEKVFPLNNKKRRYAAWETYLIGGVFDELYKQLKPQYKLAIEELRKGVPRGKFSHDPKERLVSHLMIAYFYKVITFDDSMFQLFYKTAKTKYKSQAVSFAGRHYVASENKDKNPPDYSRLKQFWEWRLNESKSVNELMEFGWWIKKDFFDNEWMLKMLIKTLEKTNGIIEVDFRVIDTLNVLVEKYPELVARCLLLYIKVNDLHHRSMRLAGKNKIKSIIVKLSQSEFKKVQTMVDEMIDYLLKLGYNDYLNIKK